MRDAFPADWSAQTRTVSPRDARMRWVIAGTAQITPPLPTSATRVPAATTRPARLGLRELDRAHPGGVTCQRAHHNENGGGNRHEHWYHSVDRPCIDPSRGAADLAAQPQLGLWPDRHCWRPAGASTHPGVVGEDLATRPASQGVRGLDPVTRWPRAGARGWCCSVPPLPTLSFGVSERRSVLACTQHVAYACVSRSRICGPYR